MIRYLDEKSHIVCTLLGIIKNVVNVLVFRQGLGRIRLSHVGPSLRSVRFEYV